MIDFRRKGRHGQRAWDAIHCAGFIALGPSGHGRGLVQTCQQGARSSWGLRAGVGLVLVVGAWRARAPLAAGPARGVRRVMARRMVLLARTPRFADLWNFWRPAPGLLYRLKLMAREHCTWRWIIRGVGVGPGPSFTPTDAHVLPSAWQELNLSHRTTSCSTSGRGWAFRVWLWGSGRSPRAHRAWRLLKHPDPWIWSIPWGCWVVWLATFAHGLIRHTALPGGPDGHFRCSSWVYCRGCLVYTSG